MADDEPLQTNTYNWSQTNDQVTITFLVPDSVKSKDLEITFERQALRAGLQGQEPVFSVS
jgi:HSP20 family molecular chaperone IbpA